MKLLTILLFIVLTATYALTAEPKRGFQIRPIVENGSNHAEKMRDRKGKEYWVQNTILASIVDLERAYIAELSEGNYKVNVVFRKENPNKLYAITKDYVGKRLAIIINGKLVFAGKLFEPIKGDTFSVVGNFSLAEALKLADDLNLEISHSNKAPDK